MIYIFMIDLKRFNSIYFLFLDCVIKIQYFAEGMDCQKRF